MNGLEMLEQSKNELFDTLSNTVFSWNSVYGVLLILFLVGICVLMAKKIGRAIMWGIGFVLFLQIMHVVAFQTQFGEVIPQMQVIFKYEPLVALAQLCVGTKLCEWLLWIQAFLNNIIGNVFSMLFIYGRLIVQHIMNTFRVLLDA